MFSSKSPKLDEPFTVSHSVQWRRQGEETGGDTTSAESARFLGGFGACLPKKILISRVSKTIFLAFFQAGLLII